MEGEEARAAPIVQELAGDVPARYIVPQHDRPVVDPAVGPIPVVDLRRLSMDDEELAKLRSALETWGLVVIVANHGMEVSLMDAMMNVSKEFFLQPIKEKQKYSNLIDGKHFQLEGYGSEELKSEDQTLNWSDRLYLKVEPEDERNLTLWPKHPKRFRDVLHEYAKQCNGVTNILLLAMAKFLELKEDYFVRQIEDSATTYVRVNYYPPCPRPDLVFGVKAHSDATLISVLMMDDDVGGLQVLRDGIWYEVPTRPHTLLINLGDFTEISSNGTFTCPVHRVVTNAEKGRTWVVLFFSPGFEEEVGPAEKLIDEKELALYKKLKVKDYVDKVFELFSKGERAIDTVKMSVE